MSSLTTNGYKKPATGDRAFWSDLEFNIDRVDQHSHNGSDSVAISPKNLSKSTAAIAHASWSAVAGQAGTFKQTITVPTGYTVDNMQVKFYITSATDTGHEVHPSIRKVTATTYDILINDNTLDLAAIYG